MAKSKARSTSKPVKSYEEQLFEKYEKEFLDGNIDVDLTREMSRTFSIIETMVSVGNDEGIFWYIHISKKRGEANQIRENRKYTPSTGR